MKLSYYRKPVSISTSIDIDKARNLHVYDDDFIDYTLKSIVKTIQAKGKNVRIAVPDDLDDVVNFLRTPRTRDAISDVNPYEIYRFIEYGHIIVLETPDKEIIGTSFDVAYNTPRQTSYTKRIVISEEHQGKLYAEQISLYCALCTMKRGAKERRGLVKYDNMAAHYTHINRSGAVYDDFIYNSKTLGAHFSIMMPLDSESLTFNTIDHRKITSFCRTHKEGVDFVVLNCNDFDKIVSLYTTTEFKIAAFVMKGIFDKQHHFLALSPEMLQIRY